MDLADCAEELAQVKHQYALKLADVRQYENPNLTPEGLRHRKAELTAGIRAQFLPKITELESQVHRAAERLTEAADKVIPAAQGSTRDAWARVEMLLAAGKSLPDITSDADAAQLQAIQEWAPTWLAANRQKAKGANIGAGNTTAFENSIRDRWAEILPAGDTIREALEAKPVAAELAYTLGTLRTELEGKPTGNTLAAAFGATQAADEARQRLQVRAEAAPDYSEAPA